MAPPNRAQLLAQLEAPTFSTLDAAQRRALILRDQLRYVEPHYLDANFEGVGDPEPPRFTMIEGVVHPPLTLLTLKVSAKSFDLGNVVFPEEGDMVNRVLLVVEGGRVEMRTMEALKEDGIIDSIPIHNLIAGAIVDLFKEKHEAIIMRMTFLNHARQAAYELAQRAALGNGEVRFDCEHAGEFLS